MTTKKSVINQLQLTLMLLGVTCNTQSLILLDIIETFIIHVAESEIIVLFKS